MRPKAIPKLLMIGLLALLLVPSAWAWQDEVETIDRSFTVDGVPEIYLRNVDGRTRLTSHEGNEVRVRAVKTVSRARDEAEARQAASEVKVLIEQVGNRIEVETKYPKKAWSRGPRVLVHFEVEAPRQSDLDIKSVDGNLDVTGFEGDLQLATVDGNLTIEDCAGEVLAKSVDGDADLRDVTGRVEARTVDGDLNIHGRMSHLEAHSTDGDLTIRVEPDSVMESGWSLRTTDGDISVVLPEGFGADLDVKASDGDIESDHPMMMEGKIRKSQFQGQLYSGGYPLRIRTSDGSIRLLKR
jgi:hypothetical protein